jgi:hypothetical protein
VAGHSALDVANIALAPMTSWSWARESLKRELMFNARALKYASLAFSLTCLCNFQTGISAEKRSLQVSRDAADVAACQGQLNIIYGALLEYQKRNQNLPRWLSDLVPEFIDDPNTLVCAYVRNTGNFKSWKEKFFLGKVFNDPGPDCSYAYEFCTEKWFPGWTTRTYKERQMELMGFSVPIVRCFAHRPVLNLGFDGSLYPSSGEWEDIFGTNANQRAIFHTVSLLTNISGNRLISKLSLPRKPGIDARMLDLTSEYNASLLHLSQIDQWGKLRTTFPEGLQRIGGIDFDARGLVHLGAKRFPIAFPEMVQNISVNRKCASIHFLHGATFAATNDWIGSFLVHFRHGQPMPIPIIYGRDVNARWSDASEKSGLDTPKPAWVSPPDQMATGKSLRLYVTTWKNEHPDSEVATIDFVSEMTESAPFLLAITVE